MGKRRRQVILHSPGHSDPYDRPHPTPTLRPDDPQRLACFFVLADLDYRKVALKRKRQSKHKLDERGILLITNAERPRQLG
jgi:hypothetical protein